MQQSHVYFAYFAPLRPLREKSVTYFCALDKLVENLDINSLTFEITNTLRKDYDETYVLSTQKATLSAAEKTD